MHGLADGSKHGQVVDVVDLVGERKVSPDARGNDEDRSTAGARFGNPGKRVRDSRPADDVDAADWWKGALVIDDQGGDLSVVDREGRGDRCGVALTRTEQAYVAGAAVPCAAGFEAVVHADAVRQAARLLFADGAGGVAAGSTRKCTFEFLYHPEYLVPGTRLILRDGRTRAVGTVVSVDV